MEEQGISNRRSTYLQDAVVRWPTPSAEDNRDRGNMDNPCIQRRVELGKQVNLGMAVKSADDKGSLNPDWVEWLLGIPIGWTDIEAEPMGHPGWDDDPAEIFPTATASKKGAHSGREIIGPRQVRAHKSGKSAGMTLETYAAHHPAGEENIPRLTTRKEHRVNRLKACGNGVVPQQAALALKLLTSPV